MKTENLAIVFIDIAGFTPRTSSQTREENLRMLKRFDELVRPLVRAYNGRVVKTIGDAFLLTFRSPTDAVLCSTAVHDRLAETDSGIDPAERFTVRAAVNAGDVRVEGGDVFGEAVNIAARIEGKAPPGEVYFSEAVYLSMTRTEVPSIEVGYAELKGIPGQVRLYRVPRAEGAAERPGMPYGGIGLERVRGKLSGVAASPIISNPEGLLLTLTRFVEWWREGMRRSRAVQYGTGVVVIAIIWFMVWLVKPRPVHHTDPVRKFLRSL